jgi:hypothetical protein
MGMGKKRGSKLNHINVISPVVLYGVAKLDRRIKVAFI